MRGFCNLGLQHESLVVRIRALVFGGVVACSAFERTVRGEYVNILGSFDPWRIRLELYSEHRIRVNLTRPEVRSAFPGWAVLCDLYPAHPGNTT